MAETIQNTVDRLTAFISENYTDVDTAPGTVISELLIKLAASIQNEQYNTIESLSQGAHISAIAESDEDTYSPIIDKIASNYNTYRSAGSKVKGKIKVTLSEPNGYYFPESFGFIQPSLNLKYTIPSEVRVSPEPSATLDERQLYSNNGLYYFILDVEAEEVGTEYQVSSGTVFSIAPPGNIVNFVKAEAYGNFSSGSSQETDKQLIEKIKYNLGNSRLESASGISKNFRQAFTSFQTLSVCGANDIEMVRSKQNALGLSTFGKADVYVRSSLGPEVKQIVKAANKISENTWQVDISKDDVPGFYNISSIVPLSPTVNLIGTLVPTSTTYGYSMYAGQRNNEILSAAEARFTKYQTATIVFNYDDKGATAIGDSANFELHANYQPNIADMQDILLSDEERLACADYLVKAAIPCMVSLQINLVKKKPTDTYDSLKLQNLKKDIFKYINSIPFGSELHASNLVKICHNYGIKRVDLPIQMTGVILCPDNTSITITDADVLSIPTNLAKGITPKTTLYFIDYYRVENGVSHPIDNIGLNIA